MHQLTTQQLVDDLRRQQLADAAQQRPARRLLALRRATHRAGRAERRMHRAVREAQRLRAQLEALEHSRTVITLPPAAVGTLARQRSQHVEIAVQISLFCASEPVGTKAAAAARTAVTRALA